MYNRFYRSITTLTILALTFGFFLFSGAAGVCAAATSVPATTGATLTWDPNSPAPDGYRVFERTEGQSYDYSHPVWEGSATTADVGSLNWDTTYYFVVRAYAGTQESPDSDEVSFMTPKPVPSTYSIAASAGANGSISPAGTVSVAEGSDQTFTIAADAGYHVADVEVDGISKGAITTYTFSQVSADHTLSASFAVDTATEAGPTGGTTSGGSSTINSGANQTSILLEAEDGDLQWPMEIADDTNASAGGYVWVPSGTGNVYDSSTSTGLAVYHFNIPADGDYVIWGREMSSQDTSDSFFVSVDDQADMVWHTKEGGANNWVWDVVSERQVADVRDASNPTVFHLSQGAHTLTVKQREDGTRLDQLLITADPNLRNDPAQVQQYVNSLAGPPAGTTSGSIYDMMLSKSADRSGAALLDGAGIDGDIYVFVEPETDIQRVDFYIDGSLRQTENVAPYDLAGTASSGLAVPFDTKTLSEGSHTFSARVTHTDGTNETIAADANVYGTDYNQWFSGAADRSDAQLLDGAKLKGSVYVFVQPATGIQKVDFYIDGSLRQTENFAPYDLAGTADSGLAVPFDTKTLSQGTHTFSARVTRTDGTGKTLTATVSVDNSLYSQWVSSSADRSNAQVLDGATLNGNAYVFVAPITNIKQVEFFIDGNLRQTENLAPFDLAGTTNAGLAAPFDAQSLTQGTHVFSARITKTDGSSETIIANAVVGTAGN